MISTTEVRQEIDKLLNFIEKLDTKNPITLGVGETFYALQDLLIHLDSTLIRFNDNIKDNENKATITSALTTDLLVKNEILEKEVKSLREDVSEMQDGYTKVLVNVNTAMEKMLQ